MRHRPRAGSPDLAHDPGQCQRQDPPRQATVGRLNWRSGIGPVPGTPDHHGEAANAMADDKAKIDWTMLEASAAEPAPSEPAPVETAPAASPPTSPAGKIVFHCSNGHRIVVAATMGGQRGKCSKCGVAVRIPGGSASPARPSRQPEPQAGGPDLASGSVPDEADEPPSGNPAEEPRGHGGAAEPLDQSVSASVGQAEPREDMFSGIVTTGESHLAANEFVELSHHLSHLGTQPVPGPIDVGASEAAPPTNPTAALVARLFQEMEHGGIVELHLVGGSVILPEFYERRWSAGSHGLFASRAADGTVTLTAVAWDAIQKIIVRQVDGLPDGMFE